MSASNSSASSASRSAKVVTVSSPGNPKSKGPGLGVQLLTAGTAACIADVITFPLDTVKVRLQVHNSFIFIGPAKNIQVKKVTGIFRFSSALHG